MTLSPSSVMVRGSGPIRPRTVIWTPVVTVSTSTPAVLVTGVTGQRILVCGYAYANAANVNIAMSIRWSTNGTSGSDYFKFHVPSDGGGVVVNLFGCEADCGTYGDSLYGVIGATGTTYFNIGYLFV